MTPERWQHIEALFAEASELPAEEVDSFLEKVCGEDTTLREEVRALLSNAGYGSNPTLVKAISDLARSFPESPDRSGQSIGPYRILERIGQGGMGTVYKAIREDQGFRIEVALKLVTHGVHNQLLKSKFHSERAILSRLEHPFIARFVDGGNAEDGTPYFAMEFVDGFLITDYCESNSLSIKERLILFRKVCSAVQYLHQNLVIHRDLKPSNILITKEGSPKLLDFGIAKLLNPEFSLEEQTQTKTLLRMMTPDFASPEQVLGLPITTASDIYSLGAILFELLTEQRAHQFKNYTPTEVERVVCRTEMEKPSTAVKRITGQHSRLQKVLTGDLDNIVLMSMRKEPARRYGSVEQFSEDIRKHLENLPVIARGDTYAYRAGKFVRRHKLELAALAIVMITLLGGIVTTWYQARRADEQAKRAEQRFREVRKLANTFLFDFHEKIRNLPGSTEAKEMVAKTAQEYLDSLATEAEGDLTLQRELAEAYQKLGDVQGSPYQPNLGQTDAALNSYQKSLDIFRKLSGNMPEDLNLARQFSRSHYYIGDLQLYTGKTLPAMQHFREGLVIAEKLVTSKSKEPDDYRLVAGGYNRLGDAQSRSGSSLEALQSYQKALSTGKTWLAQNPGDRARRTVAASSERIADCLADRGDPVGAIKNYRQTVLFREELLRSKPDDPVLRRELAVNYLYLSDASGAHYAFSIGDTSAALEYISKAKPLIEQLAAEDPKNAQAQHDLSLLHWRFGELLREEDPAKSVEALQKALGIAEELLKSDSQNTLYIRTRALSFLALALPLRKLGKHELAQRHLLQALEIQKSILAVDPAHTQVRQDMIVTYNETGDLLLEQGNSAKALESYRAALAIAEPMLQQASNSYSIRDLADSYQRLGNYYASLGDCNEGRAWYGKSLKVWDDWPKHAASSPFNTGRREQVVRDLNRCKSN